MEARYTKTEAGREEIRTRSRGLSRTLRNLLLMVDGTRSSAYLVGHIQGIGAADLERLAAEGLIEALPDPVAAARPVELDLSLDTLAGALAEAVPAVPELPEPGPAAAPPAGPEDPELRAAVEALSYQQLYKLLTEQSRERLGMIRGYKLALDVERTQSLEGLQNLAVQFVATVREIRGEGAAIDLRRALERAV